MAFKLYKDDPSDPPKREVNYNDLDNKAFWCKLGEAKEKAFVEVMGKIETPYTVAIHPNKNSNRYHPDLLVEIEGKNLIGEVKIKNSPLFYGGRYNVDPQFALTMDLKDSFNYDKLLAKNIDLIIFAWVKWEAHEMVTEWNEKKSIYNVLPMRGIWVTRFSKLRKKELSDFPPEIHWYKERYRKPPVYIKGHINGEEVLWVNELVNFEPRLQDKEGVTKGISSNGFMERNGETYPAGQSSGSYVFDLSDESIFEKIYYKDR